MADICIPEQLLHSCNRGLRQRQLLAQGAEAPHRAFHIFSTSLEVYTDQCCTTVPHQSWPWKQAVCMTEEALKERLQSPQGWTETENLSEISCSANNFLQYLLFFSHGSQVLEMSCLLHKTFPCSVLQTGNTLKSCISEMECLILWVLTQSL